MVSDEQINLPERQLAEELAVLVAEQMWDALGNNLVDGEIYNIGQSNFEEGCHALNLVGIYKVAQHYTRHKVIVPLDHVSEHMKGLNAVSRDALDALLSSFIENAISYRGELSGTRNVFSVPKKLQKAANLLAHCGYMEKLADGFLWTEKISSIMQHWYIWDESGACRLEQEEILLKEQAKHLATSLPLTVRRKVIRALKAGHPENALIEIGRHWDGNEWKQFPIMGRRPDIRKVGKPLDLRAIKFLFELLSGSKL